MKIAGLQTDSIVDGPGVRLSIYFQGCPHSCPGCHNPETHDYRGGREMSVKELLELVDGAGPIDGVTISGGEPFEQAGPAAGLAAALTGRGLDLVLYSGYTFENLLEKSRVDSGTRTLLRSGSLLVDGPFILSEQDYSLAYRGSRNQRLIDLPRSLAGGRAVTWSSRQGRACI